VIALPRDVLTVEIDEADAPAFETLEASPGAPELEALQRLLNQARRPFLILGGSRWDEHGCAAVARFAERFALPVATSYRRAPLFDALHPCYAGDLGIGANPALIDRIKRSDLVIALGGRLNEIASQGYSLFEIPGPAMNLVHIYPGAEELGRVYAPRLAILATPRRAACALSRLEPPNSPPWREATEDAHESYLEWSEAPTPQPGPVNLAAIMVWLRGALTPETVITNGAGNYAAWIHRFYRFRRPGTHFAPISASMGYGAPAAVAIKRLDPAREVVSIAGDGDFLMNGQEFATAVQYDLPITFVIFDNAMYGTIRMHQEREFPGRVEATDLKNPDFAALARAYGGFGATVEQTCDFPAAFEAARASGLPAIVHVKFDGDGVTPMTTLSAIRGAAEG
jgi:acetolactate synthase-1/2/3 large subunit